MDITNDKVLKNKKLVRDLTTLDQLGRDLAEQMKEEGRRFFMGCGKDKRGGYEFYVSGLWKRYDISIQCAICIRMFGYYWRLYKANY